MSFQHYEFLFLFGLLLPSIQLTFSQEANNPSDTNIASLSDDEISYALSELSVDDLNTLSELIDVLGRETDVSDESEFKTQERSGERSRFKRESSDSSAKKSGNNLIPNVNEAYIRQLEDSFPNIMDQSNQEDKEKPHIRVKRDKKKI